MNIIKKMTLLITFQVGVNVIGIPEFHRIFGTPIGTAKDVTGSKYHA